MLLRRPRRFRRRGGRCARSEVRPPAPKRWCFATRAPAAAGSRLRPRLGPERSAAFSGTARAAARTPARIAAREHAGVGAAWAPLGDGSVVVQEEATNDGFHRLAAGSSGRDPRGCLLLQTVHVPCRTRKDRVQKKNSGWRGVPRCGAPIGARAAPPPRGRRSGGGAPRAAAAPQASLL